MSFSITGTKITQSGTDADLSGLSGVAGVTTSSYGDLVIYNIGDNQLEVTGTLSHNPDREILIIGYNAPRNDLYVTSTGTYNYGLETTPSGTVPIKTTGCGIYITQQIDSSVGENQFNTSYGGLICDGTFNWIGGTIFTNSSLFFIGTSTLMCRSGVMLVNEDAGSPRMEIGNGSVVDIIGIKMINSRNGAGVRGLVIGKAATFNNLAGLDINNSAIALLGNAPNAPTSNALYITDAPALELTNGDAWGLYQQTQFWFYNYASGSVLADSNNINRWNDPNGTGYAIGIKQIGFNVVDSTGSPAPDVTVFVRDTDSTTRPTNAERTWWTGATLPDLENDQTYTWITNASGVAANQDVVHCFAMGIETAMTDGKTADKWLTDLRTNNQSLTNGSFTGYVHSYLYGNTAITLPINGNGALSIDWKVFADRSVTELVKATVDTYTEIETTRKAYDRMKSWKLTNIEVPTADTLPFSRTGDVLEAGAYDVVASDSEPVPFAFDGTAIRLKTTAFQNSINTSGSVESDSFASGVTIDGASFIRVGTIPAVMNILNSTQGLSINNAGTYDVSDFNFSGNTNDITVDVSSGTVTIVTGGASLNINDLGSGATVVIDNSVTWTFNVDPTGGTFAMLNLDKWNTFQGVYTSHATAQATITTPASGDYYAVDADSNNVREEHGYYNGSQWVTEAITTLEENIIVSSDLGGPGASAQFTFQLPPNSNWRWYYDTLNATPKIGTVAVGTGPGATTISLVNNPSFDGIPASVYTDVYNNYLFQASLTPADHNSVITAYLPTLPEGSTDHALVMVEYMRLTVDNAEGALVSNDASLIEVSNRAITVRNDTLRIYPLSSYPAGTKCIFPCYIQLSNYTIEFAPVDSNGNYVSYSTTPYSLVSGAEIVGILPANLIQVNDTPVTGNSIADEVWDALIADHTSPNTYGKLMDLYRKSNTAVEGSVTANATTTSFDTDLGDPTGTHDHLLLLFTTGNLTGYSAPILTYTNGGTNTITVEEPLLATPDIGSEFIILQQHIHPISEIQSGLATATDVVSARNFVQADIAALNDFNPAVDTVAHVTLVDTTTTNTDMRGTDGANTVAPDNASIAAILVDTDELQLNQGAWATATGFATSADVTAAQTAVQDSISALNDFNPAVDTVAHVTLVDTTTVNTDMRGTDGANTVAPDNASIAAILVDTNELQLNQGGWATATGFATPTDVSNAQAAIQLDISNISSVTPADIWGHTTRTLTAGTKDAEIDALTVSVGNIPTNPVISTDTRLGYLDASIASRSTFNPTTDTVAHVTLVDTTTTNTDMRGTDGANTTAPDNAGIAAIKSKTDNLPLDPASESNVTARETTESEIHTALDNYLNKDDWKAGTVDLSSVLTAIAGLNDVSAADVWGYVSRTLTDAVSVAPASITNIATAVEGALLDENDGQAIINAIVTAIGNANVDEIALVSAIRTDLERAGGLIDLTKDQATLARKFFTNRDKIDVLTNTMIKYDDNGTTVLKTFDLKDQAGNATSTTVYEKVPR